MKKLLLLAIFLGLTGCGDNNQSDTTQTNTQSNTLQQNKAAPAVANYSLATSPQAMSAVAPLQGWSITQSFIEGASTLINANKDSKVSGALVTPNAKQVAEILRGGAAGIALSIAVDQLLDAVDWVLDPANNQIKYKEKDKPAIENPAVPLLWATVFENNKFIYDSAESASRAACQYKGQTYIRLKIYLPRGTDATNAHIAYIECRKKDGTVDNWSVHSRSNPIYDPNANVYKTIPLEAVAEQVITNADAGSLDAQVATNIAAQNILNDVVQAEPVVQELENNAKDNCPSGIIKNGSCWVCEKELYYPMSRATRDAKTATRGKSCKDVTNTTIKSANATLFRNLINARIQENACWSPPDPNHATALVDAQNALRLCEN